VAVTNAYTLMGMTTDINESAVLMTSTLLIGRGQGEMTMIKKVMLERSVAQFCVLCIACLCYKTHIW